MEQTVALKKTPLNSWHRTHGARMVPFAGWDMPVEYSGIVDEHLAVRTRAAIFDVSHMGEIEIAGRDALAGVQRITSNDASHLEQGQAQYSALTTPAGTFVDDLLVYRLAVEHYMLVVNAGNTEKAYRWIAEQTKSAGDVVTFNASSRYALLAVQGPQALGVLQALTAVDLRAVRTYSFAHGEVAGVRAMISRTGYTGEDGFELFVPPNTAERVWMAVLDAGKPINLVPAGLGARDTLRLEAAMRLYGQEIDENTSVLEAGLGWVVAWDKGDFIGRDALVEQKRAGVSRKLVGFELIDPGIARHGHEVFVDGEKMGLVTSGTQTPFLKKAIGLAYLPANRSTTGTGFEIDIRGRRARARVVPLPFYKRDKASASTLD
jgi:aminomethyltransferase